LPPPAVTITAIASDHIIAQQSSLVGSIGVLFQFPNFTELLKTVGVKVEEVKSTPLRPRRTVLSRPARKLAQPSTRW